MVLVMVLVIVMLEQDLIEAACSDATIWPIVGDYLEENGRLDSAAIRLYVPELDFDFDVGDGDGGSDGDGVGGGGGSSGDGDFGDGGDGGIGGGGGGNGGSGDGDGGNSYVRNMC